VQTPSLPSFGRSTSE
jgi:hypothetical protein